MDDFLVGKYFGATSLGYYNRSYSIMLFPTILIIESVARVMFPALSEIQNDVHRVRKIYLKTINIITFFIFPAMTGLLLVSNEFVSIVFGSQWEGMTSVVKILCIVGIIQTIINPVGWIYMSQGHTGLMFKWGLFASSSIIISFVIGVYLGSIETVAWSYLVVNLLLMYPSISIPGRLIQMKFLDVLKTVYKTLLAITIMSIVVELVGYFVLSGLSIWLVFMVKVIAGLLSYIAAIFIIRHEVLTELYNLINNHKRI